MDNGPMFMGARRGFDTAGPPHRPWPLLALIGLLALPLGWHLFGPRGVDVELVRKTWRYEIKIEKLIEESASAWCDELPAGAREIERRSLLDPSGARPQAAEHCRYLLPQWRSQHTARAEGDAATPSHWPRPLLSALPTEQLGAQRLGERQAFHEAQLRAASGQTWICKLSPEHWSELAFGRHLRLQIDRRGVADCASLTPI